MVKKYSEFINYPIKLYMSKDVRETVEVEDDEESTAEKTVNEDGVEITEEEEAEAEPKEKKTKTITNTVWDWNTINDIKAIWMREKSDISEREYHEFYKTITKDSQDPAAYTHFQAEGEIDFKAILYMPKEAPSDLYDKYYSASSALKLYVRRVLITEEFDDLMPKYLGFIKGVVDSDDLPLNVSREQLQQMKMIKVMSKKLVRKALDMIKALADAEDAEEEDDEDEGEEDENTEKSTEDEEDKDGDDSKDSEEASDTKKKEEDSDEINTYEEFWKSFGKNIKLGVIEDTSNRNKLAKLLRFRSTNDP